MIIPHLTTAWLSQLVIDPKRRSATTEGGKKGSLKGMLLSSVLEGDEICFFLTGPLTIKTTKVHSTLRYSNMFG